MAAVNTGKVVAGALAAGLVINVVESIFNLVVLPEPMDEMLTNLGLEPIGGGAIGGFVALAFVLGFLIVWIYAAIRPRYGAGPVTAMKAGLAVWLAFYGLGTFGNWLMGFLPTNLFLISLAYTSVMMLAAAYVGGMVYAEWCIKKNKEMAPPAEDQRQTRPYHKHGCGRA